MEREARLVLAASHSCSRGRCGSETCTVQRKSSNWCDTHHEISDL